MSKVLLVNLAYSLTAHSSRYKLNLEEKLISLKLDPNLLYKLPVTHYPDNMIFPYFLFILGYGTLHLKL